MSVTKSTVYPWIADKAMSAHIVDRPWKFQTGEIYDRVCIGVAAEGRQLSGLQQNGSGHTYNDSNTDQEEQT